jgi:hypothetical protein
MPILLSLVTSGYRGGGGVKRPGHEADHAFPSSVDVTNAWICTSIRVYGVGLNLLGTGATAPYVIAWGMRLVTGFLPQWPVVDVSSGHVGFVVNEVALGKVFSEYFGFPLEIITATSPHSSSIIRGWYNRQNTSQRTRWTQFHSSPRNTSKLVPLPSSEMQCFMALSMERREPCADVEVAELPFSLRLGHY